MSQRQFLVDVAASISLAVAFGLSLAAAGASVWVSLASALVVLMVTKSLAAILWQLRKICDLLPKPTETSRG